jgi:hypothetical protein
VLDKLRPLVKVAADLDDLRDVVVGGQLHRANVDLDEVVEEVLNTNKTYLVNDEERKTQTLLTAASRWTSLGHVALNISVCRSGRIWPTILRICGSKPMSSMRSASSMTR